MIRKIEFIAIGSTLALTFILGFLSIYLLGEYGWTVFFLLPILIGYLPPFITSRKKEVSRNQAYALSFMTLFLACVGLLVFALEGLICIFMAAPILILMTLVGSYLAYTSQGRKIENPKNITLLVILSAFGFMSFDSLHTPQELIAVKTKIVVDASIEKVWENVVTFDQMEEPSDWVFQTGLAYPTHATIEGTGVGAIRYCNFSTGSFVEPITKWDAPHLLAFDVREQPIPMNELNPFWEVHPPHLDGYFKSYKGQFKLTKLEDNRTELEGTTWYQVDINPEFYWSLWSDFIIHRIHKRVLKHIKTTAEKG